MCDSRILSQKGPAVISQCAECKSVYIWHHNLVLNFTAQQFLDFRRFATDLDCHKATFPFPDGSERLVLRTPNNDINFTFTIPEWQNFHAAMDEAVYMQEVLSLIE